MMDWRRVIEQSNRTTVDSRVNYDRFDYPNTDNEVIADFSNIIKPRIFADFITNGGLRILEMAGFELGDGDVE